MHRRLHPIAGTILAILLCQSSLAPAQQTESRPYHVFSCQHKPAAEVERMLLDMLPTDNGATHIVVDKERNQLLMSGSDRIVELASQVVQSVDQPRQQQQQLAGPPTQLVRAYACSAGRQPQVVTRLRRALEAGRVRVTADPVSGQVFVLATARDHEAVRRLLEADEPPQQGSTHNSPWDSRVRQRTSQGPPSRSELPHLAAAATAKSHHRAATRFLPLTSNVREIEQRVVALFGRRLRQSPHGYSLDVTSRQTAELAFDTDQRGLHVTADTSILQQLSKLAYALDELGIRSGRRTSVVGIERTDRTQVQRAIDAIREESRAPRESESSAVDRRRLGPLALVAFVEKDSRDSESSADGGSEPERLAAERLGDFAGNIEVEVLPDLDVIILRGRDRDVGKLADVIQQLERFSQEAKPQVRIVPLQHARSEAIQTIVDQIKEDLTGTRQGRVSVTPLIKPNAVLVVGWGESMDSVVSLIGKLDTPVAPESQFAVFRLAHARATAAQQTIQQFFLNRQGLGPNVVAVADVRSNSVIVYAAPRDMAEVRRLVESVDVQESNVVQQARILSLEHSLASDLAPTLQAAIAAARGDASAPSTVLELLTIDPAGRQLLKTGVLASVQVTANPRNNTLIVSGPANSMDLVEALVRQLDSPVDSAQIKVFRIINGDATSLIRMLQALLPSQIGQAGTSQLSSAEDESSLAPLRFSVDTRTNSIIATGSEGDLQIIEALLLRLDEEDLAQRKTEIYKLKNAPALDVAAAINEFLRSERQIQEAAPGTLSPFEQIEKEVVVVPEPVGNSLIISATPRYFTEVKRLVIEFDERPLQVLIEVLIAEVMLNDADEFGVELGLQDSVLFDRSLLGDIFTTVNTIQQSTEQGVITSTEEIIRAATNTPGFNFNNIPLGNSGSRQALDGSNRVGGQGLTHFEVGRINNELGFGGLVLSASSESVSILIRALQESRRVEVLSRPHVRTLDNQPAFIQVGQRVPRIVQSNITSGGFQSNQVDLENVGLIIGVTPRISPDGMVVMEIDAEKSALGPEQEGVPISVSIDGSVVRSPRVDIRTAQATVSAADGETIVLGGLITKNTQEVARRVPYLADIPLLGDLFRYDSSITRRTELLIILTPRVIRSPEDDQRLLQTEMAQMSWCTADVQQIAGSLDLPWTDQSLAFDVPTQVIYPDENPRGVPLTPPEPGTAPPPLPERQEFDRLAPPVPRGIDSGPRMDHPELPAFGATPRNGSVRTASLQSEHSYRADNDVPEAQLNTQMPGVALLNPVSQQVPLANDERRPMMRLPVDKP